MSFSEDVYNIVRKIPKGKVSTYADIAKKLKSKAYRAVGTALRNNPNPIIVPCHRVVKSDGTLGNYTSNKYTKSELLIKEGIKINKNKIVDFDKIRF